MDVVIYARFSSSKQHETSIEAQLKVCYEFCEQNKYNVVGEYIDRALSGRSDERPDFLRMIEDSNKKLFQGIVVYQLDRFARDRYDSAIYKHKLKKNGVRVYSAKEHISDDASGVAMEGMLETFAEYYSVELSQRVKRNLKLNAEQGYFNGGYPPLGYKTTEIKLGNFTKKKLEIDTLTAPIVKEIFEMRANGTNILDIVKELNSKGYKTIQGKEFKKNSLQQILKNKRYIGTNIYNDEEFPNTIPAIIDKELFDKVQEIIEKNKYAPAMGKAKEEYILTTKLFCGHCKEPMTGTCGTSVTGAIYYYYTCNGIKKKKCSRKNIQKHLIENIVVNKCRELLTDKNIEDIAQNVYKICQKENSQSCLIKALEKEVKELNKNIENLLVALENGQNADLISERITQKRVDIEKAKQQLAVEQTKLINLEPDQIKFFLESLRNGDINDIRYRKTLVNIFVNRIYLYDDKYTMILNVGNKKITINNVLLKEMDTNFKKADSLFFDRLGQPKILLESQEIVDSYFFDLKRNFGVSGDNLGTVPTFLCNK